MARPVSFRCPNSGLMVQSTLSLKAEPNDQRYEPVMCPACRKIHLVNVATGRLLSDEKRQVNVKSSKE